MDCKLAAMLVSGCLSVGGPSAVWAGPGPGEAVVMKAGVAKMVITPGSTVTHLRPWALR
jgi:hypothetical protein